MFQILALLHSSYQVLKISDMDRKLSSLSLLVILELRICKWEETLISKKWGCGSDGSQITE